MNKTDADVTIPYGFCWQLEYLKKSAIKGDQIFFHQAVSCLDILVDSHLKQRADGIIAAKRKNKAI
jgi:hypothetical protein